MQLLNIASFLLKALARTMVDDDESDPDKFETEDQNCESLLIAVVIVFVK